MKKKIAILLAAVMTATMVPMTVFADSSNSVNKTVTVKDDDLIDGVYLKIQPGEAVEAGDSIVLTFENGKIDEDTNLDSYAYSLQGHDYDYYMGEYNDIVGSTGASYNLTTFGTIIGSLISTEGDARLPYRLTRNSQRELEVKLFPLPSALAGETYNSTTKPYYYIPMPVTADGTGDVTVTVDANGTSIRGGSTYTIATSSSTSGSTTLSVDDIMVGSDDVEISTLTVKESVQGTLKIDKSITLKLNSGYDFDASDLAISAGTNANFNTLYTSGNSVGYYTATKAGTYILDSKEVAVAVGDYLSKKAAALYSDKSFKSCGTIDGNSIDFALEAIDSTTNDKLSTKAAAIKIDGLYAVADDDDNFGDIKVTISGTSAGITKETIKVSERGDYGFAMKAVEDPTTIYAGRIGSTYSFDDLTSSEKGKGDDYEDYMTADAFKEFDLDDNLTATVEFSEITADSWNTGRKLQFTVPEGVKIANYEIDEYEDCKNLDEYVTLTDDGRTLSIKPADGVVDVSEASSFELQLTLSADATFTGDVALSVSGAGMSEGDVEDVVIAKVVAPVTVEATTTKTNLGYQKVATSDIVITEAEDGVLVKNGTVNVALDSVYGSGELGFADEDIDYEVEGDLKVKNFKVTDGVISFKVDSSSSEASKLTIKNVKIGTTRSVPQGVYGLKIGGSAIVSNYSEDLVDAGEETTSDGVFQYGVGFFDENDSIKVADYINVITETGTLDTVVKVTIDEKTILVDDQAYDMDVAPYIQTSSNSTMVPLRFVMVALGVDSDNVASVDESNKVTYDANTKTATIFYALGTSMTTIQFQAGSNIMYVNGAAIPMENGVQAEIVDGRMFVPFRAIGTAINVNVGWDAETRTATYNG